MSSRTVTIFTCDRCGVTQEASNPPPDWQKVVASPVKGMAMDCCGLCFNEFMSFFNNGKAFVVPRDPEERKILIAQGRDLYFLQKTRAEFGGKDMTFEAPPGEAR